MKALAVVLLLGLLGACGATPIAQSSPRDVVIIHNNPGGDILKFKRWKWKLKQSEQVVISGYCASACIMLLELDNACYVPGTILKIHGVSKGMFQTFDDRVAALYDKDYMREIPESLHHKFWTEWRHKRGPMSFTDIRAEDVEGIRKCEKQYY